MFNPIQKYKILCLSLILLSSTGETTDCSYNESDSCIIERETKWNTTMGNITCGSKYSSCRVTCDGADDYVCSYTYLICPNNDDCNECIINCISSFSCHNSIVLGNKCKSVEINIGEFHAGNQMQIYAPTNNGSLTINTINGSSQFISNYIYSNKETNNIEINCDQNGNICKNNTVYAESIDGDLDFECYGYNVDCDYSQIYCPINNDSLCNIECSQCGHSEIYSINGFENLNLQCGKDSVSCYESSLYCGTNKSQHLLMWMNNSNQWIYKNNENPCMQTQNTIKNNVTQHTQNNDNNNNENISNSNSENIQISISDLIYFGISIILLLLCCCILIGLFFIYNFFRFKKKQKELEVYVDMTGDIPKIVFPKQVYDEQKYDDNHSNIEPVCETPKVHATSIEVLKPPSVTANIIPIPAPPPPPPSLKFFKIDSASEYIESDHDDNETITTTTDINTVSSNFEINSTASSDLKPHFQSNIGSMNIEMAKIERIDEQKMSDEGVHQLSDEGDHESSSDEEMYNKSNNATKGEVTRGNDENDNDQNDNDENVKVISDTITVHESVV